MIYRYNSKELDKRGNGRKLVKNTTEDKKPEELLKEVLKGVDAFDDLFGDLFK